MDLNLHLPLGKKKSWIEANQTIGYLLKKHWAKAKILRETAFEISTLFSEIYQLLDNLCIHTCRFCPDPCCLKAKVWFDLKDLLFLHLNNEIIPASQLLNRLDGICLYLGPKGCLLDRQKRPFICTLYLCPPQLSRLRKNKTDEKKFIKAIHQIKTKRIFLEDTFTKITS